MAVALSTSRQLYDLEARDLSLTGRGLRQRFHPDAWQRATQAEREHMARDAHEFVRSAYGLSRGPLHFAHDWPAYLLGHFDPRSGAVTVNARLLKREHPTLLLHTLAHEHRPAVQQERMEGRQVVPYSDAVGDTEVDAWKPASG